MIPSKLSLSLSLSQSLSEMWQLGNMMDKMLEECASSDKAKTLSKQEIRELCLCACTGSKIREGGD